MNGACIVSFSLYLKFLCIPVTCIVDFIGDCAPEVIRCALHNTIMTANIMTRAVHQR